MFKVGNKENRAGLRRAPVYLVLAGTMALSGCSWTPDWANPVEWYRGTRDWVAGDDIDSQRKAASASQPLLSVGSVLPQTGLGATTSSSPVRGGSKSHGRFAGGRSRFRPLYG